LTLTYIINKKSYNLDKLNPIECGFEPIGDRPIFLSYNKYPNILGLKPGEEERERYYIKFYIIGILFLIFDLEALLLYPFTTILYTNWEYLINTPIYFIIFLLFIYFVILGLIYEFINYQI
jgi:NADH:ubiquinone oxidoreductase subunit 3 (subunit A)